MNCENTQIKKVFEKMHKKVMKEIEKNPNYKIIVKITLEFGGATDANADIIIDETVLIQNTGVKKWIIA